MYGNRLGLITKANRPSLPADWNTRDVVFLFWHIEDWTPGTQQGVLLLSDSETEQKAESCLHAKENVQSDASYTLCQRVLVGSKECAVRGSTRPRRPVHRYFCWDSYVLDETNRRSNGDIVSGSYEIMTFSFCVSVCVSHPFASRSFAFIAFALDPPAVYQPRRMRSVWSDTTGPQKNITSRSSIVEAGTGSLHGYFCNRCSH